MIDSDKQSAIDAAFNKGWFTGLNKDEVTRLVELSSIKTIESGEQIYDVGELGGTVYCVIEGLIKISIAGKDHENFPLTIWESGHWFGEGAFHQSSVMPLEAKAMKDARVLAIPLDQIDQVLDNNAIFYKTILRDMVERTQLLYKLIEMLLFGTLKGRVAARILHLIKLFGKPVHNGILLPMEFSQADFAKMSGGSRQRINKIFRTWAEEKVLSKRGKLYTLHDPESLEAELNINRF